MNMRPEYCGLYTTHTHTHTHTKDFGVLKSFKR